MKAWPCYRCAAAGCPRCGGSGFWFKGKAIPLSKLTAPQLNLHFLREKK